LNKINSDGVSVQSIHSLHTVYTQSTRGTAKCLLYELPGLKSSHSANTVYVSILQEVVVL